jgi:hypothetical protein
MGESNNFKMLEFPLNLLQMYYGYLCDLCPLTAFIFSNLNYKMVIFLSQTESTPKHFFLEKKALHKTMKEVKVQLHLFWALALDRGE